MKTIKILAIVLFCQFIAGCMAAGLAMLVVPAAGIGINIVNIAREQYPDINFDKPAPVEVAYDKNYNDVWNGVIDTIMTMKESPATIDKNSGILRTNKKSLNEVSWFSKAMLNQATFLYELNVTVRKKNNRVSVEVMVPFWEEKAFIAQKERDIPEASSMVRHIFYRNLEKRIPSVATRLPDGQLQDVGYALHSQEAKPKDNPTSSKSQEIPTVTMAKIKKGKACNVRPTPTTKGNNPIAKLRSGTKVEIIEEKGSWNKIRFTDSRGKQKEGWITKISLE